MGRPVKKIKDKFKRFTLTLAPEAAKIVAKKKNKSGYINDLILKDKK